MKYYLAGRMSGIPNFNFPTFEAAAADLRARGYDIVSPREMDAANATGAVAEKSVDGNPASLPETWGDLLARDVKVVSDEVQGIVFLSDDWV